MPLKLKNLRNRYAYFQRRFGSFWPIVSGTVGLVLIFITGVVMYMHLEGWDMIDSLYMVVITLSTVGFQEVHPLSPAGRTFTVVLILTGVGSFMFMAGSVAQLLVEGKLQQVLGRRRVQKTIDKFKDHFIICGWGRIGSVVAQEILNEGHPVVVIENDPEALSRMEHEDLPNLLYLPGDATSEELLERAGLERARCLITALSQEAANVYVVLTARQVNPNLYIVSRADTKRQITRLERAGADRVVMPHMIGGVRMAQSVLRPTVISFVELAVRGHVNLQMEELEISKTSELAEKNLIQSEIRPRFNVIIIAIKKSSGEMVFNPAPDYVLKPFDTMLAVGGKENLLNLRKIL